MGRIPEATIQAVRDRVDLVDLIGRHVTLKRAGRSFKGLCPFHQEKTPSFHVNPDRGTYHCFGCEVHGNAFDYLIQQENLTFPEAVRSLAAPLGIEVPEEGGRERGEVERLVAACEIAQRVYRDALASPVAEGARRYLAGRGFDLEAAERFGIGFAPDRWDSVARALEAEKLPAAVGERAGLLRTRSSGDGHYDLLRGRLTFPIRDARGRIVAFGGRALAEGQEPKYLNSPETPLFHKREALYGLPEALEPIRKRDRVVVCEGYFDRIALHRAGIEESVASCGTALGEGHARALRRRSRNVVLLFDGDEAGRRAVWRALETLLPEGLRVRAAALPGGEDPDDFLRRAGSEALRALVDQAPAALELATSEVVEGGVSTPWEKADAVARLAPLLAAVPDAVERGAYTRRLALAVRAEIFEVEAAVRGAARREAPPEVLGQAEPRRETHAERHLSEAAALLVTHPSLAADPASERLLGYAEEGPARELLAALVESGRADPARNPVAAVEGRLGDAAAARLSRLLAREDAPLEDAERAAGALGDIAQWFERQRAREDRERVTSRFRDESADRGALLLEKNRELERRRAARAGAPAGSAT